MKRSTAAAVLPPLAVTLVLGLLIVRAASDNLPGREAMLPETDVKDRFFGYLIGLIGRDMCGILTAEYMGSVLEDCRGKTSIPFETIVDIRRECSERTEGRQVSITFEGGLHTPVPYSILGYRPGNVDASRTVRFLEWDMPRVDIGISKTQAVELTDVYVFAICEGWAVVDIHAWIDKLLGGLLDDTRLVVMVLFKYKGEWHGLAAGYGPSGEGRSGVFNFRTNRILLPTPGDLRVLPSFFRDFVRRSMDVKAPLPPKERWKASR